MKVSTVLLVDDDQSLLTLMSIRLRRRGYQIVTALSAHEALSHLSQLRLDVLVTDLQMDGMDGMALFEEVKKRFPWLPVIVLTAHGTIPDAVQATKEGVFAFLTKPFDGDELVKHIQTASEQSLNDKDALHARGSQKWREAIITRSDKMEHLLAETKTVAGSDVSVLIQCDSGTGKELLAKAIHKASPRCNAAFVAVNCTAIPESLFESEFFGHVKGAFSGANNSRIGLMESANGGTLFLDEIGDMSLEFQAKLLRALEEREVRAVGSNTSLPIDLRVISATHQDLEQAVKEERFREDLFYRLNVVMLEIPSLAQRREDIPLLVDTFLSGISSGKTKAAKFTPEAVRMLMSAPWPGNVRQLKNVVEQCAVLCGSSLIAENFVKRALRSDDGRSSIIPLSEARDEFERDYLMDLLRMTSGNVSQAAKLAKRNRSDFHKLLNKHHIDSAQFRQATAFKAES